MVADWDCTWRDLIRRSPGPRATELVELFQDKLIGLGTARGADMGWASRAADAMVDLGLTGVETHTSSRSWRGGTGTCPLYHSNSLQKESELVAAGMSLDDLVEVRKVFMDPGLVMSEYLLHTTVGCRPVADH